MNTELDTHTAPFAQVSRSQLKEKNNNNNNKKAQLSSAPYVVHLLNQTHHKLVQFENISLKSESNSAKLFGRWKF